MEFKEWAENFGDEWMKKKHDTFGPEGDVLPRTGGGDKFHGGGIQPWSAGEIMPYHIVIKKSRDQPNGRIQAWLKSDVVVDEPFASWAEFPSVHDDVEDQVKQMMSQEQQ